MFKKIDGSLVQVPWKLWFLRHYFYQLIKSLQTYYSFRPRLDLNLDVSSQLINWWMRLDLRPRLRPFNISGNLHKSLISKTRYDLQSSILFNYNTILLLLPRDLRPIVQRVPCWFQSKDWRAITNIVWYSKGLRTLRPWKVFTLLMNWITS